MSKKRYRIQSACPQCGCSGATALDHDEMMERYGNVPNIELECAECMIQYTKKTEDVCPEWAADCNADT